MKLDLAAGKHPREGFKSVDVVPGIADYCVNLTSGFEWPWRDGSIEELHSSHFIEHIEADYIGGPSGMKDRLFWFFDEAFRVIEADGLFTIIWPALKSSNAFRDPTHRRFLPLEFTHYLSRAGRVAMGVDHYNVECNWVVEHTRLHVAAPFYRDGVRAIAVDGTPRVPDWTEHEINTLWEVQNSYEVILRADKSPVTPGAPLP